MGRDRYADFVYNVVTMPDWDRDVSFVVTSRIDTESRHPIDPLPTV